MSEGKELVGDKTEEAARDHGKNLDFYYYFYCGKIVIT